jgi:hypothetical protein
LNLSEEVDMGKIQYVTDEGGQRIAVQIPLDQWALIKAELGFYGSEEETTEILMDERLMNAIRKGKEQAEQGKGRFLSEVEV